MTRVAVIGSNSFSGSDFIDLLLEQGGYEVIGISRSAEKSDLFLPYKRHHNPPFRFHQFDLNYHTAEILEVVDAFRPEYVVNFAAQSEVAPSWEHPDQWFQTNAVALARLVHGLRERDYLRRYVHISSPEVYGTCVGRVAEDAPLNPTTPYAASKAAADMLLFTYVKNFGFPLVMIRSTNVYGAHQQLWKIIPRAAIYVKLQRPIELHGGGRAVKSYIHIRDVSRGELAAMVRGEPGSIYHLSPERGYPVRDVVASICQLMGTTLERATVDVAERLGQDAAYVIDSSRARFELGWSPTVGLKQGLASVVDWINSRWEQVRSAPTEYVYAA